MNWHVLARTSAVPQQRFLINNIERRSGLWLRARHDLQAFMGCDGLQRHELAHGSIQEIFD
jgi:hypothetical protein